MNAMSRPSVLVIGAGPSGLAALASFAEAQAKGAQIPDITCVEKQSKMGGLWNYTWRTGLDQFGERVHGSMYRFLWSNGPKEVLEMSNYTFDDHFGQPIPSFPPREVLADYILGRAKKLGAEKFIKFETAVRDVRREEGGFIVTWEDLNTRQLSTTTFDHVICAVGHFSVPNVPEYPGFASFHGRILHAHDFRDAREFSGRRIVVVGSSYSAEDIALQCYKYGAKQVTISYRNKPMGFKWPENISEKPLLTHADGDSVAFSDGSSVPADAIILCTGYKHSFPFMQYGNSIAEQGNRLWPLGLYKGVVHVDTPGLYFIGAQDQYLTFSMFDAQAWFVRDVIMGKIPLPPRPDMEADNISWRQKEESLKDCHDEIDFQCDYTQQLIEYTDYPRLDMDLVKKEFKDWEHDKEESILGYRNKSFKSPITGTVGPVHHTPWVEAMDDSMACFLKSKL